MQLLERLMLSAKQKPARIVVCEAADPRILQAAHQAQHEGIATMILVGDAGRIAQTANQLQLDISHLEIEDPATSAKKNALCSALVKKRAHKGMTEEKAKAALLDPLCFASMLVEADYADGSVAGAVYSTADVVRSALQYIGQADDADLVSSFFLMLLNQPHHPVQKGVIFSDCGLIIDPTEEQLAAIALAAVQSAKTLLQTEPRVAMLSFPQPVARTTLLSPKWFMLPSASKPLCPIWPLMKTCNLMPPSSQKLPRKNSKTPRLKAKPMCLFSQILMRATSAIK